MNNQLNPLYEIALLIALFLGVGTFTVLSLVEMFKMWLGY